MDVEHSWGQTIVESLEVFHFQVYMKDISVWTTRDVWYSGSH